MVGFTLALAIILCKGWSGECRKWVARILSMIKVPRCVFPLLCTESNISEIPVATTTTQLTARIYAASVLSHIVCELQVNVTALLGTKSWPSNDINGLQA